MANSPDMPPLGVMPYGIWRAKFDPHEPNLADLVQRYDAVCAAIARYRAAGFEPYPQWLEETGVIWLGSA